MSTATILILSVWLGCLIAEALDGFQATRRLFREMAQQWAWVWRHTVKRWI
jgi:hypothetical protein